jgi:hypothetical protein
LLLFARRAGRERERGTAAAGRGDRRVGGGRSKHAVSPPPPPRQCWPRGHADNPPGRAFTSEDRALASASASADERGRRAPVVVVASRARPSLSLILRCFRIARGFIFGLVCVLQLSDGVLPARMARALAAPVGARRSRRRRRRCARRHGGGGPGREAGGGRRKHELVPVILLLRLLDNTASGHAADSRAARSGIGEAGHGGVGGVGGGRALRRWRHHCRSEGASLSLFFLLGVRFYLLSIWFSPPPPPILGGV